MSRLLLLASLAAWLAWTDAAAVLKRIEAPCTACKAVAAELQRRIDAEPVRNHLDLRHRLDKEGNRYGKVIEYKASELRAVELLDGLCDRMRDYALVSPQGKKTVYWLKVKGEGAGDTTNVTRSGYDEENAKSKRLEAYCGSLIEEFEEEVYAGIMKGGFDTQGVEPVLCNQIVSPCPAPAPAGQQQQSGEGDGEAREEDGSGEEGEGGSGEGAAEAGDAAAQGAVAAEGEL